MLNNKNDNALLANGLIALGKGDYDQALKDFVDSIAIESDNYLAHFYLGETLFKLGKYGEAGKSYKESIKANREFHGSYLGLGKSLIVLGKPSDICIKYIDKAIKLDPNNAEAHLYKGMELAKSGNEKMMRKALKSYDKAISKQGDYAEAYFAKGIALYNLGMYEESINCYDKVISLGYNLPLVYVNKGNVLYALGRYEDAKDCYEEAIRMGNIDGYSKKAMALHALGNVKEALHYFSKALELNPEDLELKVKMGSVLYDLKDFEGALQYFNKVLEIDPDNIESNAKVGAIKLASMDLEGALRYFHKSDDLLQKRIATETLTKADRDLAIEFNNKLKESINGIEAMLNNNQYGNDYKDMHIPNMAEVYEALDNITALQNEGNVTYLESQTSGSQGFFSEHKTEIALSMLVGIVGVAWLYKNWHNVFDGVRAMFFGNDAQENALAAPADLIGDHDNDAE